MTNSDKTKNELLKEVHEMDIRLPNMDGYKAVENIRQFNKDAIIIAQSAYGLPGDREKAIDAGCNDYITKPIIKEDLLALIQKYFRDRLA
jgi:CheY-like chemotaxis protein